MEVGMASHGIASHHPSFNAYTGGFKMPRQSPDFSINCPVRKCCRDIDILTAADIFLLSVTVHLNVNYTPTVKPRPVGLEAGRRLQEGQLSGII